MNSDRRTIGLIAALCIASMAMAQSKDSVRIKALGTLKSQLDSIAQKTPGTLGFSLHHLKTGDRVDRLGDDLFATDSTLKVAIMGAAIEQVTSGKIGYKSVRTLIPGDRNAGGFFFSFRDNTELEFKEVVHQMIGQSDN